MRSARISWTLVAVLAGGATLPRVAAAQERLLLEGQAGVALPAGELRHFGDAGPDVALELGYRLSDRVTLHADGGMERLGGRFLYPGATGTQGPALNFWDYTAGAETRLWSPGSNRNLGLTLDLGAGASRFDAQSYIYPPDVTPQSFQHTYPAGEGILRLRYRDTSPGEGRISAFLGAGARVVFTKTAETQALANMNAATLKPFSKAVSVPLMAGLNIAI